MTSASARSVDQLADLIAAVTIESERSLRVAGARVDIVGQRPIRRDDPCYSGDPLIYALRRHMYAQWHAPSRDAHAPAVIDDDRFRATLVDAYPGQAMLTPAWRVLSALRGGEVCAEHARRTRVWRPGQYVFDGAPARAKEGDIVRPLVVRRSFTLQPGFFYAFGSVIADERSDASPLKVYFNIGADGAAALLRLVCGTLERRRVPFQFKCLSSPADYTRLDAGVLYLGKRYAHVGLALLEGVVGELGPQLRDGTALLAKRLAPGIAIAEEPDTDDSFGTHRTRAIAEGICAAFRAGRPAPVERLQSVLSAFEAHNISIERPYLNAVPDDPYGLDLLELRG